MTDIPSLDQWSGAFTPTEDWFEGDDKPIKTVGQAHISIEVEHQGFDPEMMAYVFGVDRYMDEYGDHRIHDVKLWEWKAFDIDHPACIRTVGFMLNSIEEPSIPLCPIGLGAS